MGSKFSCLICGIHEEHAKFPTCYEEIEKNWQDGPTMIIGVIQKEDEHVFMCQIWKEPNAFYGTSIMEEAEKLMQLLEDFKPTGETYELLAGNRPWYKFRLGAIFWEKIKRVWNNFRKGKNVGREN